MAKSSARHDEPQEMDGDYAEMPESNASLAYEAAAPGKRTKLTKKGLADLEAELERLRGPKKQEIAERLKQAKAHGDLSENSEYDEAKNDEAQNALRILKLEAMLRDVDVIDDSDVMTDAVNIGCVVRILDVGAEEELEFQIVGSAESNPQDGKLSDESPVGKALIGHAVGDAVAVSAPDGVFRYKVLGISKKEQ